MSRFLDSYKPERHYMRGPGPKWHAKHAAALMSAAGAQPDVEAIPAANTVSPSSLWMLGWMAPTAVAATLALVMLA